MNRNIFGYILTLVILLCTLVSENVRAADPLDNWHWKNPIPQGNALHGVSYGSNKFVAVGDYGTILTSTDLGINWNNRTALNSGSAGTRENLRSLAFGNISGSGVVAPGFVAVGDNGTILKSTDGNSWALDSTSGITTNLHSVAFGIIATLKQYFVAVGANGTVIRTNDGTSWSTATDTTAMTGEMLNGVAFGPVPNTFVTVSNNGNIFYSIDNGAKWIKSSDSNSSRPLKGVSFVNGNFIAVGTAGAIISSANGVNWVVQASGTAADLNAVTYGSINDTFVVVGNLSKIIGSTTGFTAWRSFPFPEQSTPSNYNILAVTNDGDKTYVAVGDNGEILRYNPGTASAVWTAINTGQIGPYVSSLAYNTSNTNTGSSFNIYAGTNVGLGWGVSYSANAGASWSMKNTGLISWIVNSLALNPGVTSATDILYAGTISGLHKSIDGGTDWGRIVPPLNINITAGNTSNTITWAAVTGATSYNIYRSTSAGVTKSSTLLSSAAVSPYPDGGLTNGSTYYYAITTNFQLPVATNHQESALSSEVSAKPQASQTYIPDSVSVTAGDAINTITWQPVTGATSYSLSIDGSKSSVTSPYIDSSLINGINHTYSVTAVGVVRTPANIAVSKGVVTWDPVPGAGSYEISINGGGYVAATSPYTYIGRVASYNINALNIQTAAAPSTNVTESLITWPAVIGATSYDVSVNGGIPINVAAPATSYTHNGAVTSNSVTVVGGASAGSTSIGTVTVTKTDISWPAVALTNSYSIVVNGGAAVTPVVSPYTYNGAVTSVTVTAIDNTRIVITGSLVSTITWDAPFVEPTTYTITINTVVQPVQNAPLTSFNFAGVINPGFTVISTKTESDPSSIVGATPQRTSIQLTAVNTVIVDPVTPSTIYLGNASGLFKSIDAALTFTELLYSAAPISFANVNAITVDRTTPATIYVGATGGLGNGIYKSTNGGVSWALLKTGVVNTIALDPITASTIYIGTSLGAFKSSDSGDTWNVTNPGLGSFPVNYFGINPVLPNVIYMGTDVGIFVTYNSGIDWSGFSNGLVSSLVNAIAFDSGKPDQIYAGTGGGGMYKLTDVFDINWSSQRNDIVFNSSSKSSSEFYGIGFGADNFVAVGNNNTVALLGNASLPVVTGDFKAVVYGENSFMAVGAFGSEGAVYQSDTAGVSWNGPLVDAVTKASIASSGLYAVTYGNGTFVAAGLSGKLLTYTGNVYNNSLVSGVTTHLRAAAFGNGTFVVAGDNGAIITSSDAASWTVRSSGITTQINAMSYGNGSFVAVGAGGVILISTDNGASWQSVASPTSGNFYGVAFGNGVFSAVGEDAVHGTIFTSSDYGSTWSARPSGTVNSLYAVAFGKGQFYASGRFGTVIMSDTVPAAPATVTSTTPADGATGVPVNSPITATFSANMNGGTITTPPWGDGTAGSFKIVPAVTTPVAVPLTGAISSYDSANLRATLSHTGLLAYGTNYTATLTTTIMDAAGNALPAVYTWQFTTAQLPDTTPPSVAKTVPAADATSIDLASTITVTFNEAIDKTTINESKQSGFILKNITDGNNIPWSVTLSSMGAVFTPTVPLIASKFYEATVTTAVKDLSGNAMIFSKVWSFKTSEAIYSISLTVADANGSVVSTPNTLSSPVTSATNAAQSVVSVKNNTAAMFSITPSANYHIADVKLDGTSVLTPVISNSNSYTLGAVSADHAVSVSFAINTYALTTSVSSGNGALSTSSANPSHGTSPTVIITPVDGNILTGLFDNGTAINFNSSPLPAGLTRGTANINGKFTWTYTISNIAAVHNITASFSVDNVSPTVVSVSATNIDSAGMVDPATKIDVVFSEAIDSLTINQNAVPQTGFTLTNVTDGGTVPWTVDLSVLGKAAFTPSSPLLLGKTYKATVANTVTDLYGNALTASLNNERIFSTRPATHKIILINGANGVVTSDAIALDKVGDKQNVNFLITPNVNDGYALYELAGVSIDGAPVTPLPNRKMNSDGVTFTYSYTMNTIIKDQIIAVTFVKIPATIQLKVNVQVSGTGSVSPSSGINLVAGERQLFNITSARGYELDTLSFGGIGIALDPNLYATDGSYNYTTLPVTQNSSLAVAFKLITYNLTMTPQQPVGGKISVDAPIDLIGKAYVYYGGTATFTIKPEAGYILKDLKLGDGTSVKSQVVNNTFTLRNITAPYTLDVEFEFKYTVTATAEGKGTISPAVGELFVISSAGTSIVSKNTVMKYTLTPATGYKLDAVGGTCGGTLSGSEYTINAVTTDCSVKPSFSIKSFDVTVAPAITNGKVTISSATAQYGGSVDAVITANPGFIVTDIRIKNVNNGIETSVLAASKTNSSGASTYTILNIQNDYEITAVLNTLTYPVNTSAGTGGTITATSAVAYDNSKTIVITQNTGYKLLDATLDGISVKSQLTATPLTFELTLNNITAEHTVVATFVIITQTITASVNNSALGTISPNGAVRVNYGGSQKYQITPATGASLKELLVDNVPVTPDVNGTYTITNVIKDHSIVSNFVTSGITVAYPDGDINSDGKLDIADVLLALQMSIGLRIPTPTELLHGNVGPMNNQNKPPVLNTPGVIDIEDVVVLLQRSVGNILPW